MAIGEHGWWHPDTKRVWCPACGPRRTGAAVDHAGSQEGRAEPEVGVAGGSALAEYHRRRTRRQDAILAQHPLLGKLILAATAEPQSTHAWARGALGEQRVGARLNDLTASGAVVLHDRRIPGTNANIDHIVVARSGVWIVDSKHYRGQVERCGTGGWLRTDIRLFVGRRDCTKLVTRTTTQVAAVQRAVQDADLPIHAVLCFTGADWSLFAKPFELDGVLVTWPSALVKRIARASDRSVLVRDISERIAKQLPNVPPRRTRTKH
jgi:Nuclease-related domain